MKLLGIASLLVAAFAASHVAHADELSGAHVIFARDHALWRTDAHGKANPTKVAALPDGADDAHAVNSLRTDPAGTQLLANIGGAWYAMPLTASDATLQKLACGVGDADISTDGTCVVCADDTGHTKIIRLDSKASEIRPEPNRAMRMVVLPVADGDSTELTHELFWGDDHGVWAIATAPGSAKRQVAKIPPKRNLSISPDGKRALGVFPGFIRDGKKKIDQDLLYGFALDGVAALRKAIRGGVPIMWSHDSKWALVQDGANACIMRAVGGEYKCWACYTAVSIAPDGSYALVLGSRDEADRHSKSGDKGDKAGKKGGKANSSSKAKGKSKDETPTSDAGATSDDGGKDTDATTPSSDDDGSPDDGASSEDSSDHTMQPDKNVPLPTGPLSLLRAQLDGAFTDPPVVVERLVEGAAVWIPAAGKQSSTAN